jgi:hypothetical protein
MSVRKLGPANGLQRQIFAARHRGGGAIATPTRAVIARRFDYGTVRDSKLPGVFSET